MRTSLSTKAMMATISSTAFLLCQRLPVDDNYEPTQMLHSTNRQWSLRSYDCQHSTIPMEDAVPQGDLFGRITQHGGEGTAGQRVTWDHVR